MSVPGLLEKLISLMLLAGFIVFSIGYIYLTTVFLEKARLPQTTWITIIGIVLIILSFLGLGLFGRFFEIEE